MVQEKNLLLLKSSELRTWQKLWQMIDFIFELKARIPKANHYKTGHRFFSTIYCICDNIEAKLYCLRKYRLRYFFPYGKSTKIAQITEIVFSYMPVIGFGSYIRVSRVINKPTVIKWQKTKFSYIRINQNTYALSFIDQFSGSLSKIIQF